jgi:cell division protein FtsX
MNPAIMLGKNHKPLWRNTMNKLIALTMITSTLVLGMSSFSASAADVKGKVDTSVKVGAVIQKNTGIANKNEVTLGSVTD